jgi:hypothetical protein
MLDIILLVMRPEHEPSRPGWVAGQAWASCIQLIELCPAMLSPSVGPVDVLTLPTSVHLYNVAFGTLNGRTGPLL